MGVAVRQRSTSEAHLAHDQWAPEELKSQPEPAEVTKWSSCKLLEPEPESSGAREAASWSRSLYELLHPEPAGSGSWRQCLHMRKQAATWGPAGESAGLERDSSCAEQLVVRPAQLPAGWNNGQGGGATTCRLGGLGWSAAQQPTDSSATCCADRLGRPEASRPTVEGANMAPTSSEPARATSYLRRALLKPTVGSYKVSQATSVSGAPAGRPSSSFRPGRSPGSIQRQTNARLTRHRLKIQQQRQDQLVQLAAREREHLIQLAARARLSPRPPSPQAEGSQSGSASSALTTQVVSVVVYNSGPLSMSAGSSAHPHPPVLADHQRWIGAQHLSEPDSQTIGSASSTTSIHQPFCKICHVGASKDGDRLISPCKCAGTMQFIHCGCLLKWLEISNRSNERPISCELCAHEYTWHKKFNYGHIRWPKCSRKDLLLHFLFLVSLASMLFSVLAPMFWRRSESDLAGSSMVVPIRTYSPPANHHPKSARPEPEVGRIAHEERFVLMCAASFFISFFLAIYVQTRARDTLYSLINKFLDINQTYYITEYDHGQMASLINNKQQQANQPGELDIDTDVTSRFGFVKSGTGSYKG